MNLKSIHQFKSNVSEVKVFTLILPFFSFIDILSFSQYIETELVLILKSTRS